MFSNRRPGCCSRQCATTSCDIGSVTTPCSSAQSCAPCGRLWLCRCTAALEDPDAFKPQTVGAAGLAGEPFMHHCAGISMRSSWCSALWVSCSIHPAAHMLAVHTLAHHTALDLFCRGPVHMAEGLRQHGCASTSTAMFAPIPNHTDCLVCCCMLHAATGFMARSASGASVAAGHGASGAAAAKAAAGSSGGSSGPPRIRPPQSAVAAAGFACQVGAW